jgi:ABC-type nitrate/sulfonate/bicarbonate transport system substrate-binding protein
MALKNKAKVLIAVAVALLVLIAYGAYRGSVRETVPTASFDGPSLTGPKPGVSEEARLSESSSKDAGALGEAKAPEKELKLVRTWTRRDCTLAPWLVGDKLGFFEEEGVRLVFTGDIQPPQWIPSILTGANDVATFHPNTAAVSIYGGAPLKGVFRSGMEPGEDLDPSYRHMWWFVNPEKHPNVKSFADLKDLPGQITISLLNVTSCADFLGNLLLDKYGVPRDRADWVTMPDVQAIQALKQGHTDVAGVHPPFYKGMLDAGQLKIADSSEPDLPPGAAGLTYYFFTEDFIKNNPEAVRGFARAMIRSQKWINDNPEQARIWTEEAIGIPVSANHYYADQLTLEEEQILPWIKDMEEQGAIPEGKITPEIMVIHDFEDPDFWDQ